MKYSIRKQFAGIFIGLLAGTILLCWFVNNTFLEKYYLSNKEKMLYSAYETINSLVSGEELGMEQAQKLYDMCMKNNISVVVINADSQMVYWAAISEKEIKEMAGKLFGYQTGIIPGEMPEKTMLPAGDKGNECLEMYGTLDNGLSFIIRTPRESITESVKLANQFLAYVGMAAVLISGILIWMITKKITDPILEMTEISERMIHLDFEAKYHGKSSNEIDLLGENINQLSQSLEKTISELKTANNELQNDIAKKEKIDEMRKEFLSNVSHELKTPIALIQGYAEGLQEGINDDPESRDFYCDVIIDEANKMNNMVKKLLTLNHLEFGNDVVSMERFDIVALVHNYIQSAQILTRQNEIEVRMMEYEPIYVWADEFKTEEVFMNYFSNAVNHCSGSRIIDIKLEQRDGKVRVSVFNTGEPIPEDSIEHLWEKFYKVDKARTRAYGGSGVGLSIVKAIMESMNQQYGVMNYNNGVLFWFELETVGN